MTPYLVLLRILISFLARLAMLPYGVDYNVIKLLANLITKPSVANAAYTYATCSTFAHLKMIIWVLLFF